MASESQVRTYLAAWFQLGKKLCLQNGREILLPEPVISGEHYSAQFENCWQKIIATQGKDSYLEGTDVTIEELLTSKWDILDCARCTMPIALASLGVHNSQCPCFDLLSWPNSQLPAPRSPVNNSVHLNRIRSSLQQNIDRP
jgi:hypothetical protein